MTPERKAELRSGPGKTEAWQTVLNEALDALDAAEQRLQAAEADTRRLEDLLNTPETEEFDKAVPLEAAHQVERWGAEHDAGKAPQDWYWLVGYLGGKALAAHLAGNTEKARHHCISTAAALRNWHAAIRSGSSFMRPGIGEDKRMAIDAAGKVAK